MASIDYINYSLTICVKEEDEMHRSDKKELWQVILVAACAAMFGRAVKNSKTPQKWVVGLFIGFATGWIVYDLKGFGRGIAKAWKTTIKMKTGRFWAFIFYALLPGIYVGLAADYLIIFLVTILLKTSFYSEMDSTFTQAFFPTIFIFAYFSQEEISDRPYHDSTAKEFFSDFLPFLWKDGFCQLAKDIWWLVMNCYKLPLIIWNGIKTIFLTIGKLLLHIYRFTASHGRFVSAIGATTGITVGSILNQPLISILSSGLVGGICAGILYLACKLSLPLAQKYISS